MSRAARGLLRRMEERVSGRPDRVLVGSLPEHHALCVAWRARSGSRAFGGGLWRGPGWYRLSGFCDGSTSVATVEFDSPAAPGA